MSIGQRQPGTLLEVKALVRDRSPDHEHEKQADEHGGGAKIFCRTRQLVVLVTVPVNCNFYCCIEQLDDQHDQAHPDEQCDLQWGSAKPESTRYQHDRERNFLPESGLVFPRVCETAHRIDGCECDSVDAGASGFSHAKSAVSR